MRGYGAEDGEGGAVRKRLNWVPCRVCGAAHNNPSSSSICSPCGATERAARLEAEEAARQEYESSPFGQFMGMPEEHRWRYLFERLEAMEAA